MRPEISAALGPKVGRPPCRKTTTTMRPYCRSSRRRRTIRSGFRSLRAGSGLAQDLFFAEIDAQAARCAVVHRAGHAVGHLGNQRLDIEMTLYAGLKVGDFFRRRRMLQVIECAAVGDGRDQRAQLQRGHRDAFAEGTHLAYAAELRGNFFLRDRRRGARRECCSRRAHPAELVRVVADFFKSQLASEGLEVGIIGVRQRRRQVHAAAAARDLRVFGDRCLRSRAASATDTLMVEQGCARSTAPTSGSPSPECGRWWVDRDDRSIHVAQSIDGSLANDRVLSGGNVTVKFVIHERAGGETLVIAMTAGATGSARSYHPCACMTAREFG